MCCRFSINVSEEKIKYRYGLVFADRSYKPTDNAAPGQDLAVITQRKPDQLQLFRWGLKPAWSKQKSGILNARAEHIDEKPSFTKGFRTNRIIIPADGFYEWDKNHQPYKFIIPEGEIFSFAGIAESYERDGKTVNNFAIITTNANKDVRNIHERMPVILTKDQEKLWLDPDAPVEVLEQILKPYGKLECLKISKDINKAK